MNIKYVSLIGSLVLLAGCVAPTSTRVCPECSTQGDYNFVRNERLGNKVETLSYTRNGTNIVHKYSVPVVVGYQESWECCHGHKVNVNVTR